jgi:positive regulator of sigma E activity
VLHPSAEHPDPGVESGKASIQCSGEVVRVDANTVTISLAPNPACASCTSKSGCALASDGRQELQIEASGFQIGDRVRVMADDRRMLGVSISLYLVPTVLLIAGSFAGYLLLPGWLGVTGDQGAFYGVIAGIGLSLAYVQFFRNLTGTSENLLRLEKEE